MYSWQCRFICVVSLAASLWGQATKAELGGVVRDASGAGVGAARVKLERPDTGLTVEAASRADGSFEFLGLAPGPYRINVAREGFQAAEWRDVTLRVGDRVTLELQMAVGNARETLTVREGAPLVQAERGGAGYVVEQRKVANLPLDGRNYIPLLALAPGVNLPPGNYFPRINGSRPRVSEYIYDGVSVLQPEPGQVAYYPVIDAIEEFRVETNSYSAEYGRSNGGVIMVNTKAGSNDWRGTLFEFFRNEKLNARNLFATTGSKPRFRRNQYGFVLGGPIQKNKAFFFADWQRTRLHSGVVRTSTVPTAAQRQGVFSAPVYDPATTRREASGYPRDIFPNNTIPRQRWDRAASSLLSRYPASNVAGATANNYRRVGNDDTVADQFDGRLDRYIGERHRVFGRYSYLRDDTKPVKPLEDGSGLLTAGAIGDTLTRADSIALEHTWTVAPSAVNQLRFGYTRRAFDRESLRGAGTACIPNLPVGSFADVLPVFDIVGLQQLGPPASANAAFTTSVTQFLDNFSQVRGSHSLKYGFDVRLQTLDVLQPANPAGNFQFTNIFTAGLSPTGTTIAGTGNSFASFLTGQVGRFSVDSQPAQLSPRARIAEFYLQDDWRVKRRLTLNLGVRYTLNFPSTVKDDRGAVFNLRTEKLDFLGANGFPRAARNLEKKNFAPRVGLALQLAPQFVFRAAYGMTWIEQAGITTPFTTPLFPFIQTLGQQSLDNIQPAFVLAQGPSVRLQAPGRDSGLGQGVFGVQRDNGSGYAQQWNASLQKTIGASWSLEAGYLASKLTRLGVPDVNLNQLSVEQLALGSQLTQQTANPYFGEIPANSSLGGATIARGQLLRPYPRFTTVALYRNNVGHSTYHSLQARLDKRFSRSLTFTASYTFSRLIDDAGAVFDSAVLTGPVANFQTADSFNKKLEKDVSTGNIPHIFASGFVYELPRRLGKGWQIAGIARVQSGSPVAVTQATNLNAFAGFGIQRPNRGGEPALGAEERRTGRWFRTEAFTQAPQFTIGNSSRNPVVGPGYSTLDVMAGKTIALRERLRMEIRAEAFNAMNTPPLGNPNGSFGTVAFGTITTALDPRVYELVMKIHF